MKRHATIRPWISTWRAGLWAWRAGFTRGRLPRTFCELSAATAGGGLSARPTPAPPTPARETGECRAEEEKRGGFRHRLQGRRDLHREAPKKMGRPTWVFVGGREEIRRQRLRVPREARQRSSTTACWSRRRTTG